MPGIRTAARVLLGASLVFAGASHLTFARDEFRARVPELLIAWALWSTRRPRR
ncbi:hypothetical protein [Agrococcus sp. TSP3-2-1]|uniref:hypothetical protein n=1 Tax=Agrococcus sp. TSP3-2-1 TaxID=2804583 RepID=UPI003CFA50C6